MEDLSQTTSCREQRERERETACKRGDKEREEKKRVNVLRGGRPGPNSSSEEKNGKYKKGAQ